MPKQILIIEDDPDILENLNIIFVDEGLEVTLSATGDKIDHIDEIKPDIVLVDIRLKNAGRNGMTICSQLKNSAGDTKTTFYLIISGKRSGCNKHALWRGCLRFNEKSN